MCDTNKNFVHVFRHRGGGGANADWLQANADWLQANADWFAVMWPPPSPIACSLKFISLPLPRFFKNNEVILTGVRKSGLQEKHDFQ